VNGVKDITAQLTEYAGYHRDKRNIATHFIGIPMIVVAVAAMLGSAHPYLACGAMLAGSIFYLVLDLRLGVAMFAFNAATLWAGLHFPLLWGVGLFVVGWAFQFVGHWYEGKKPAFVDDVIGLLIGPLFIVAEAGFMLGLRKALREQIEGKVGPTRLNPRPGAAPAAR
jgi:uncharacterized membrane protein YGL010W